MTRTLDDIDRELVAAVDDMRRAFARFDEAELLVWQARMADRISVHAQRVEALALEAHDARTAAPISSLNTPQAVPHMKRFDDRFPTWKGYTP